MEIDCLCLVKMAAEKPDTPLGIPRAEFIEDMMAAAPTMAAAEKMYQEKQELLAKYRVLEKHLIEKSQQYKANRPEIEENLRAVQKLASAPFQNEPVTHFQISDSLYGTARLKNERTVSLWLGAKLMVEYTFEEAEALLQKNLENADAQIRETEENLVFLRDQIITTEVTVSRLTNHILQMNRKK